MRANFQFLFPLFCCACFQAVGFAETTEAALITQVEADAIIEARMQAKADQDKAMREKINSMAVVEENHIRAGGKDVIIRRVVAPPSENESPQKSTAQLSESQRTRSGSGFEFPEYTRRHEMISVSAQIFDDNHSKVVWRDQETGEAFDIWTNINVVWLNPLSSFDTEDTHYSYFAMTERVNPSDEKKRQKTADKMGYSYKSRWQESPVVLSSEHPEYVVVTETARAVPEKLYQQMDALFAFYLEERNSLEVAFKNAEKLKISHEKYMKENPPQPKPSITNFWPGKNSSYRRTESAE